MRIGDRIFWRWKDQKCRKSWHEDCVQEIEGTRAKLGYRQYSSGGTWVSISDIEHEARNET